MEKICTLCGSPKPTDEFIKRNGKPGSWCQECRRKYCRDKGYSKYANRRDYYSDHQRIYRKTERGKKYTKKYKDKYFRTLSGTTTRLLSSARSRAKKQKLEIDLDRNWIESHLSELKCQATGLDLVLEIREDVSHSPFRPSIDRMDNKKGYTKDNCQIVCVIFNKAKSDYTTEDVIAMAKGLLETCEAKEKNT